MDQASTSSNVCWTAMTYTTSSTEQVWYLISQPGWVVSLNSKCVNGLSLSLCMTYL